jgi:SAM-dependent methyltransferase
VIAGWEWDDSLFAGAARHYTRGRLPYAPGFAAVLADALALDGRGRLLDAGCGPGTVTAALAPFFEEVVGLDPDPGMLAEAARPGLPNARWVRARAEDLPAGLGTFRVVTFASSFHWTDRARVAATVRDMLEPGGRLVHISDLKDPPASPRQQRRRRAGRGRPAVGGRTRHHPSPRGHPPRQRRGRALLPAARLRRLGSFPDARPLSPAAPGQPASPSSARRASISASSARNLSAWACASARSADRMCSTASCTPGTSTSCTIRIASAGRIT